MNIKHRNSTTHLTQYDKNFLSKTKAQQKSQTKIYHRQKVFEWHGRNLKN